MEATQVIMATFPTEDGADAAVAELEAMSKAGSIVIIYGGHQVIEGRTDPGSFISFIAALLLAYEPMKRLANLNASLQEGLASAPRLVALLDTPHRGLDGLDGGRLAASDRVGQRCDGLDGLHARSRSTSTFGTAR